MSGQPFTSATPASAKLALARVICGIDGSPEGEKAAREAAALAPDNSHIFLMHVTAPAVIDHVVSAIPGAPVAAQDARSEPAQAVLEHVRASLPAGLVVKSIISTGPPAPLLLAQAERLFVDTIAVGSHGRGRAAGVLLGSVATRLVHGARCSVLIARAPANQPFPRSVAVGFDTSRPALAALETARQLAERAGVPLRILHASERPGRSPEAEIDIDEEIEEIRGFRSPADALASRMAPSDLLVVGSRGLRGLHALGSVGEAVAHNAPCSVLTVR